MLSGEGKAFCAGGDIAAWANLPPLEMWRDWTRAGHRAFEALARLRTPLIVALTGHAFGGGLELAAVGDIRIAESVHGPAENRRYQYVPTYILRGLTRLHLEFTPSR